MKILLTMLCLVAVTAVAWAEKTVPIADINTDRDMCPFETVTYFWNFAVKDWGFTTAPCDEGGAPVWEYGESVTWPTPMWVTGLTTEGELYPNDAGESLLSPSFLVDDTSFLVEVFHGYAIYTDYDGGNLSVNGIVVEPTDGYPVAEISPGDGSYAWCVDGEPGFTGDTVSQVFSCFNLSAFMGQEIQLSFDFGSDSEFQSWGWGLAWVRVGGVVIANDEVTWTAVKAVYR